MQCAAYVALGGSGCTFTILGRPLPTDIKTLHIVACLAALLYRAAHHNLDEVVGLQAIVRGIKANNPGYAISDSKVLGFPSMAEANTFMLDHPLAMSGGVHFSTGAIGGIGYTLQTNGSVRTELLYDHSVRCEVWACQSQPSIHAEHSSSFVDAASAVKKLQLYK